MSIFRVPEKLSDEEKEEKINQAKEELAKETSEGEMPISLMRLVVTNFGLAFLLVVISIVLAVALKQVGMLIGLVFSAYLIYSALSSLRDYKKGLIHELVLACNTVTRTIKGSKIVMQDLSTEPATIHEFYFPSKRPPFVEGSVYVVYVNEENPHNILAYKST